MINPPGTYFSGGEATHRKAYQEGAILSSVDPETRGRIYRQTMRQRAAYWSAIPWGSAGPGGSYLVEETEPSAIGTGLVEWQRIFWAKPLVRLEPQSCAHAYQYREGSDLGEVPLTVSALVTYTYYHTLNPITDIICARAFKWFKIGERIAYIGIIPNPDDPLILAEDETYTRLKGHFYAKRSKFVPSIAKTLAP